jgi:hypothetical protein
MEVPFVRTRSGTATGQVPTADTCIDGTDDAGRAFPGGSSTITGDDVAASTDPFAPPGLRAVQDTVTG